MPRESNGSAKLHLELMDVARVLKKPGRILSVSYDGVLLATRRLLLEGAGHRVVSAMGFAEALSLCDSHFDLIIMGHSIPRKDKVAIVAELRRRGCAAPLLSLLRHGDKPLAEAVEWIEADQPQELLKAVSRILKKSRARAKRG